MYENNMLDIDENNDLTKEEWQTLAWYVRPILENFLLKDYRTNELFNKIYLAEDAVHSRTETISYRYNPKQEAALERMAEAANAGESLDEYKRAFIDEYEYVYIDQSAYDPDWHEESESVEHADSKENTEENAEEDEELNNVMAFDEKETLVRDVTNKLYNIAESKWDEVISQLLSLKEIRLGEMMDKDTIDYKALMLLPDYELYEYSYMNMNAVLARIERFIELGYTGILLMHEVRIATYTSYFNTAMVELETTSFNGVQRKIVQHEKNEEMGDFHNVICCTLTFLSGCPAKYSSETKLVVALAEATLGNYDKALSIFDKFDNIMLENDYDDIVSDLIPRFRRPSKEEVKGAVNFCRGLIYESQGKPMEAYAMYHSTMGSKAYKYGAERECLCLIKMGMWVQACALAKKVTFWAEMTKSDQAMLLLDYPLMTRTCTV